ncbi:hypothetical protein EDD22DRAFT_854955 [Suillus occidentalis]|nr:hypothetical protein EDD22DRAFT_854955 [Suillus occidentalis]
MSTDSDVARPGKCQEHVPCPNRDISLHTRYPKDESAMNNYVNANREGRNQDGDRDQNNQIPRHLLQHTPRPRDVVFTLTAGQLEMLYVTWAAARMQVRQELYEPALPIPPYPLPPAWPDEMRAMMVLWIARERRLFEMEMRELEYLLGLREIIVYQAQDQEVEGGSFNFPLAETTLRRFGAVADCGGRSTDRDLAQCDDMVWRVSDFQCRQQSSSSSTRCLPGSYVDGRIDESLVIAALVTH